MPITPGTTIFASDVISSSGGAGDSGKIPKLNVSGKLDTTFLPTLGVFNTGATTHSSASTGNQAIAHGLGVTPKRVRITAVLTNGGVISMAEIVYAGGTSAAVSAAKGGSTDNASGTGFTLYANIGSGYNCSASISVDATNITLNWSKSGTPADTVSLMWEAEG